MAIRRPSTGRLRRIAVAVFALLVLAGLAGPAQGVAQAQTGKVVVIVMENERYENIVGSGDAPYLNQLMAGGELFTNYTALVGSSNPNYLAMTSGLTSALSPPSPNIFQAIDSAGGALHWKEFMESAPGNCAAGTSALIPGTTVSRYTADHDPAYAYRANTTCSTNDVPMTSTTFDPANLPDFSYVVPNQCDDMHTLPGNGAACPAYFGSNSGSSLINMADNWLATVVPKLLAQPNVTVLITWDEGSNQTTPPQHIVMLAVGAGITPGSTDATAYTHYSLEAGLYSYFGLGPAPNNGATATPLPIPPPGPPPQPMISSFSPASGSVGTTVTISGTGLRGATSVSFAGTPSAFKVVSDTQITAKVPSGAATGPIAVTGPGGTASTSDFTVTPPAPPTVSSFSPTSGTPGTSVLVTGTGFTAATGVTYNGASVPFSVGSDTQLSFTVPAGATSGPIAVTTPGGTATSGSNFTVTDFALAASPASQTITRGAKATFSVTVTPISGFTGPVTLAASNLPAGAKASFSSNPVTISTTAASSTLTVATKGSVKRGTYSLTISAAGGTVTHTTTVALVIG